MRAQQKGTRGRFREEIGKDRLRDMDLDEENFLWEFFEGKRTVPREVWLTSEEAACIRTDQ